MRKTARDRKRVRPGSEDLLNGSRSTSRVRYIHVEPKRKKRGRKTKPILSNGKPLSKEALFMDRCPQGVSPVEWLRLYTEEMDLWDDLAFEALAVIEEGGHIG